MGPEDIRKTFFHHPIANRLTVQQEEIYHE
jgi:hypothetical protein